MVIVSRLSARIPDKNDVGSESTLAEIRCHCVASALANL